MEYIKKITKDVIERILSKGVKNMPTNPSAQGYDEEQIRGFYYIPEKMILEIVAEVEDALYKQIKENASPDLNLEDGNGEHSIQTKNSSIAGVEFAVSLGDENKSYARKAITLGTQNEITAFVKLAQKPTLSEAVSNGHYYLKENVFILIDNTLSETDYNQIVDIYQYFSAYGNSSIAVGQINKILANCAGAFGNGNEITVNGANGFVFGRKNFLDSYRGIIGGHLNKGKGGKKNQVLFGYALETDDDDKVVVGVANEDIDGALFEVGGGTYSGEVDNPTLQRKSIFWVKRDGVYTPLGKLSTASNLENGEGLDSLITKADKGSNKAKARGSFAGGVTNAYTENTVVETGADNSFGYGYNVKIGANCGSSFGFGWGINILKEAFKYAFGYYNEDILGSLFELGYGTGSANRKNLFTVFKDGRVKFDKLTDGTTTKTVQEILAGGGGSGGGSQLYLHQVPIHFTGFVEASIPEFTLTLNVLSSQSTAYGSETSMETLINDTFNKIVSLLFVSDEVQFRDVIASSFIVSYDSSAWILRYVQSVTQTEYTLSGPVDYEGHKLEIMTYTPTPL